MITQAQIEYLVGFKPASALVTSLYLNVDGRRYVNKRDFETVLRDLIRDRRALLEGCASAADVRGVLADLERVQRYVSSDFERKRSKGLTVFACGPAGLWQTFALSRPVRSQLVVAREPYVRPLSAMLDEFERYVVAIVDRTRARIFEIALGDLARQIEIENDVPPHVAEGGFGGTLERRIERHADDHVKQHFKQVADRLREMDRQAPIKRLAVGSHRETLPDFEAVLPRALRNRIVARLTADTRLTPAEVLERILEVQQGVERQAEEELIRRLRDASGRAKRGVTGLRDTLAALGKDQAQLLLVEEAYVAPGVLCPGCGYLGVEEARCPLCNGTLVRRDDIISAAIDRAYAQRCRVEHVVPPSGLDELGHIGAILRYRG